MIREMTNYDAMYVSLNMREIDVRELATVYGSSDPEWIKSYAALGAMSSTVENWTCVVGGVPVAVFGVNQEQGIGVVWLWGTDDCEKSAAEITRFCKRRIGALSKTIDQIICHSAEFHKQAHRWLEVLGLTKIEEIPGSDSNIIYRYEVVNA